MPTELRRVDYGSAEDGEALVALLDAYARSEEGGGEGLSPEARGRLVPALAALPGAVSVIARVDGVPAGLVNALPSFSTFKALPILNLHDVVVLPAFRGRGLARAMLAWMEAEARARGCCKLTLEVLEGNAPAVSLYRSIGYAPYSLDPALGRALFWEKPLGTSSQPGPS